MKSIFSIFLSVIIIPGSLYAQKDTTTIYGKVSDYKTNKAIVHAQVKVECTGYRVFSDDYGNFKITGVPYGSYKLEVKCPGYDGRIAWIQLQDTVRSRNTVKLFLDEHQRSTPLRDFLDDVQAIPMIAYSQGRFGSLEAGMGLGHWHYMEDNYLPINNIFAYYLSSEFNIRESDFVMGPKFSCVISGADANMGMSIIYYTNLNKGTLFFRPSLGLDVGPGINFSYGYNIPLMRNLMKGEVNRNIFTITIRYVIAKKNEFGQKGFGK